MLTRFSGGPHSPCSNPLPVSQELGQQRRKGVFIPKSPQSPTVPTAERTLCGVSPRGGGSRQLLGVSMNEGSQFPEDLGRGWERTRGPLVLSSSCCPSLLPHFASSSHTCSAPTSQHILQSCTFQLPCPLPVSFLFPEPHPHLEQAQDSSWREGQGQSLRVSQGRLRVYRRKAVGDSS